MTANTETLLVLTVAKPAAPSHVVDTIGTVFQFVDPSHGIDRTCGISVLPISRRNGRFNVAKSGATGKLWGNRDTTGPAGAYGSSASLAAAFKVTLYMYIIARIP